MSAEDDIKRIKEELAKIKHNKSTEHYIGHLKARLSKLKEKSTSKKTGGGSFAVKKMGDATAALVGFPSVGKSTLLNALTSAESRTAGYEFTTLKPIPGMLEYNKTKIQLIDAPGIIEGASEGRGGGRQILSAVRNADLLIILLDPRKNRLEIVRQELYDSGVRLDQSPPDVLVKKTVKGGLVVESTVKQELSMDTIRGVLKEFGYVNAQVLLRQRLSVDELVDALSDNRVYVPSLVVYNKVDKLSEKELKNLKKQHPKALFISAKNESGVGELVRAVWEKLDFKRIYLKKPGRDPDYDEPLIMRGLATVQDVIKELGKDFESARVWGSSVKHQGITVSLKHELNDEDVVTLS
ncbi:GTP-binding protein [archaeon]|nr:GTP-binding protein [archaeon]